MFGSFILLRCSLVSTTSFLYTFSQRVYSHLAMTKHFGSAVQPNRKHDSSLFTHKQKLSNPFKPHQVQKTGGQIPTASICNHPVQVPASGGNTYPDVIFVLDQLRVPKQTPLQHGLQEGQVDHVEQQQSQNGQVHDDGHLNGQKRFIS